VRNQRISEQSSAFVGDITGVTAGNGLSGGGTSGTVALALDLSELSTATVATGDYVAVEDITDNSSKKVTAQSIADLAPQGDIEGIVTAATSGLNGGATTGTATLVIDASRLTALGAEAALTDYVIAYDTDAAATKKVLVSNIPITWG